MAEKTVSIAENELNTLRDTVDSLTAENKELKRKLERMNEILLNAQRARFGQSSEKRDYVMPNQLGMFNEAEAEQNLKEPEPTEETLTVKEHKRKKKRTIEELTAELPVQEIILDLPDEMKICDSCGKPMECIGKKFLRREIGVIPKQIYRLDYYIKTYSCKACEEKTGYATIVQLEPPKPLMKHSLASPSTVADIMTQKYVDGIPLYRQEKISKRDGVALSRATMANWVIQCSQTWLKPLYRQMRKTLPQEAVIHADETVVQVLKEDGKPATSESRMWVYATGRHSKKQIRFFEYQPDRSGKHPSVLLKDFKGCLVTDGYSGYDQVTGAVHCGCWAHIRRKWREAMPKGATTATSKAAVGYEYCNKLAALEKKYADFLPARRREARQAWVEPLLDAYWSWVDTLDPVPGSKLEDAVTYARNQKQHLNEFLKHGDVDYTNNLAENAIRPFVVGRKNWLFSDTPRGADSSAIVYTLVETAKANGLEPWLYLRCILDELRYLEKTPATATLEQYMPWSPCIQEMMDKYKQSAFDRHQS